MIKKFLEIGKIVGTHGINGELRVQPWCDSLSDFCALKTLYYDNGKEAAAVKSRPQKNVALVKVDGITTVEQADLLRGRILYANREDMQLDEGVYFVQDILGSTVIDKQTGKEYGKITDVLKTGANDVYELKGGDSKNYYIPVIDDVVKEINIEKGIIKIVPMKGTFDDED